MYVNPFQVSLDTIIGTSTMLGHSLEDRSRIRDSHDYHLLNLVQSHSTVSLSSASQQDLFAIAPLDILVSGDIRKTFHLLEINGSGIGGFTNLSGEAVAAVLDDLSEFVRQLRHPAPVVLVAVSGKESDACPRLNRLVHEKLLYVEALKRGLQYEGQKNVTITTVAELLRNPRVYDTDQPTVVLGYIKDFLDNLKLDLRGRVFLHNRQVHGAVNDRFCLNLIEKFDHRVDLRELQTMNRCFLAGGDKGVAYALLNEFLMEQPHSCMPQRVRSERVYCREELLEAVHKWLRLKRQVVMKPAGTGLGHGIEFFLSADEPQENIIARIDRSLRLTEEYYQVPGGSFPYTLCEYVDSCTIDQPRHRFHGRKYELRVVVYRDGMYLKAFPSIVKVASESFDPRQPSYLSLVNNITSSTQATRRDGTDFMLPLTNTATLNLLGLRREHLIELCKFATGFVRHVLDKVELEPERFGLPRTPAAVHLPAAEVRTAKVA